MLYEHRLPLPSRSPSWCVCLLLLYDKTHIEIDFDRFEARLQDSNATTASEGTDTDVNFKCAQPCGPAGSKCCLLQGTKYGTICKCPKGVSPFLDMELTAPLEDELPSPPKACSPGCQQNLDWWKSCTRNGEQDIEKCSKTACTFPYMPCGFPLCSQWATCTSAQPTKTMTSTQSTKTTNSVPLIQSGA